jgi:mono/diheme cytochrome c family protein
MRLRTVLAFVALVVVLALVGGPVLGASAAQPGNAVIGKKLYLQAGVFCGSCHTLKAAGSKGRDGPNLDKSKPSYAAIVAIVTKGRNPSKKWPTGMPGYGKRSELSKLAIRDVAAFVYSATHK